MREKLIEKSTTGKKSSPKAAENDQTPEPWFDLTVSAPNSVGTGNTKDTRGEKDELAIGSA